MGFTVEELLKLGIVNYSHLHLLFKLFKCFCLPLNMLLTKCFIPLFVDFAKFS